ncbi:MAG TPA: hypothetical protein P5235_10385 [Saprospiraceae bacterium]|nr:hypothetical protein [Lewinellaceae bacterium]HPK10650.1 hypothetical protein [Saprospiraceae bacterium]HRX29787.1 hypothetical protein [Saprospiraceae bacterium]
MESNMYILKAYLVYLPLIIGLTFYVSKTLFRSGKMFMLDIFKGKEDIANATNNLFELGFYLLNLGFGLVILKISHYGMNSYQNVLEVLSLKIGGFSIYLGIMLFFNLLLFFRGRRKSKATQGAITEESVQLS